MGLTRGCVSQEGLDPRAFHGTAYLNGFVYCVGGYDGRSTLNSVCKFDPVTRTWHQVAPMHSRRCYVSVAVLDGFIYAMGGFDGIGRLNTVERYDPESNRWTLIQPMSESRSDHGLIISKRTLQRLCRKLNLFRRKNQTDIEEIASFVQSEMATSGRLQGYRWLHLRAIRRGYVVSQETMRMMIKAIDPEGVEHRRARRLRRRQYFSRGPNALWHMDSYDKLKPYGIAINGCIGGFSRFVLWMEAYNTNSDPNVIADYYISTVTRIRGCPERLRADPGTENGHYEFILVIF
uniref:Integrase core domain-containing protein n=1 Tax=Paramormyrops kingsleyae TaxID=1676925 RepID=A0A3B3RAJ2_9TELE